MGVVVCSRTSGTRFSAACSGPAWHPTQILCSPRRIQSQPCSCRKTAPFASSSTNRIARSAGAFTKNDPSASTGAAPIATACPSASWVSSRTVQARPSARHREKCAHPGPANSHNPSHVEPKDGASAARAQPRLRARSGFLQGGSAESASPLRLVSRASGQISHSLNRAYSPATRPKRSPQSHLHNSPRGAATRSSCASGEVNRASDAPCVNTTSPDFSCLPPHRAPATFTG